MQRESRRTKSIRVARCVIVALVVLGSLTVGSPAQSATHIAIFGGFGGNFPAKYLNGGVVHTKNSTASIHFWSNTLVFDVDTKAIDGGGPFSMVVGAGAGTSKQIVQGSWKARRLTYWRSIGLCRDNSTCSEDAGFPGFFNAGKMKALIELFDESGDSLGLARLTIWCSLPGIPFAGGIEQYAVRILTGRFAGRNFVIGTNGTVFGDLSLL